jgi:Zn-finger nucleic acid-binding protein
MYIPCPTCRRHLEQKLTRKDKPYFLCESCGVQVFVRFREGIERLKNGVGDGRLIRDDFVFCQKCDVAIRNTSKSIERPLIRSDGIYCPKCNDLLLKAGEVTKGK